MLILFVVFVVVLVIGGVFYSAVDDIKNNYS